MHFKALFFICFMQILYRHIQAKGKYTVIGPGTLHSDCKYTVAVAVHHTTEPCEIKVGISGPSYNQTETVKLDPGQIKNVDFNLPPLESGKYNLTAQGVNCLDNFYNSTALNYAKYDNYVFIQTDKGLYKPGDTMHYRVLFLDQRLKPMQPENNTKIYIEDAKQNRVKEINNIETTSGVYTGKFKISEHPVIGGWHIGVNNDKSYYDSKYFKVDKYVLPKFIVKVEATDAVSLKDGDIQITARANYTYGKPLNGKVTVIINPDRIVRRFYGDIYMHEKMVDYEDAPTIIRTGNMVNGKAKIDANIKLYEAYYHKTPFNYLNILATVEEEFTGVKMNSTTTTTVYSYRYSMECVHYQTCTSFQADKETKVLLRLSYVDNTNLNDTKEPVELIYTEVLRKYTWWYHNDENFTETDMEPISENRTFHFTTKMNETGFAEFLIKLPELKQYHRHSHYYKVEAKYRDEQRELFNTYQYREPKNVRNPEEEPKEPKDFFRIEYKHYSETHKIGVKTQFVVNSSQPLPYLDYNVIARGNIIESQHIELPDQPKHYNITATPTYEWSPNFAVYVYYVDDKGEYHHDEQSYSMEAKLQNEINITAPEQVKPGDNVTLNIKTAKNSFVGLRAVDQSVLLLPPDNDINAYNVKFLLQFYYTYTPDQGGSSYYPGTISGVVTLTNADYFYNWTRPTYFSVPLHSRAHPHVASAVLPFAKSANDDSDSTLEASFSAAGRAGAPGVGGFAKPNIKVRKDFSETWIFDNIENTESEEIEWVKKIPDTITSWVVTGFSMNNETGLGITEGQTKIVTFQPFFISIRLPYSVKLGEVINVPALVFNYLNKDLVVDVTLNNDADEYEFMDVTNEVLNDQNKITKTIEVPANGASGISFMLRPKIVGNIMLKYTAISPLAGDSIHKTMKVVPPGITQYVNKAYFVQLKDQSEFSDKFELEFPEDMVPASQYVEIGAVGDLLGPILNHLDGLIRKPTGCGEQTMSKLIPNYLVMKYLQYMKKLTSNLETTLRYNMESGYQNMLNFRQNDGSFTIFSHDKNQNGSTWLTAYVIHGLQNLADYVKVDENIIKDGLKFLANNQAENGTFIKKGNFYYNGNQDSVSLTSFTLLAFLKNDTLAEQYSEVINKGLEYISQNIDNSTSLKSKALGTYVLQKAKHSHAMKTLSNLRELAKKEDNRIWWSSRNYDTEKNKRWWYYVNNKDVEITSYALLSILEQDTIDVNEIFPIVKWLISQRNNFGGFSSTQDTIVGLSALIKFAKKTNYQPGKMEIIFEVNTIDPPKLQKETIQLTDENGLLYQTVEMPPKTTAIDFTAKGTGSALVQISYQYNVYEKEPKPSFEIKTKKHDENLAGKLIMDVCVQYTGDGDASNMAILEISLPSGFIVDDDIAKDIQEIKGVSNVEMKESNSLLVVYFDRLRKNDEKCLLVEAFRSHAVALQKPASIKLYDYYDTERKVTVFYDINTKLCDICDGEEECNKCRTSQ